MTNEELERAVERLTKFARRWPTGSHLRGLVQSITDAEGDSELNVSDVLALLSERAELLDTVERMRGLLEEFVEPWAHLHDVEVYHACESQAKAFLITAARAALTTGEEK